MNAGPGRSAVVVQVTTRSEDAVDWAAAEASCRDLPLRLVHRLGILLPADHLELLSPAAARPHSAAAGALAAARARALAIDPDLTVETALVPGSARRVLAQESRTAGLLVVGGPSPGLLSRLLTGQTALRLVAAAACPVTVVRALPRATAPRRCPRVVVGIDGTPRSGAAVGFALREARRRGVALTVVHAWTADLPADLEGVCASRVGSEADARRLVDRTLAPWREEFPDVPITAEVRWADAASALFSASDGAALVVLGPPGRRRLTGAVGSVGLRVLARVAGPVVIIGHEGHGSATSRRGVGRVPSR